MRNYRLKIGLDVDEVLYECNSYALDIINKRHPDESPVTINEITSWGAVGRHADERIACYSDPEFVRTQPIIDGAQKFVSDLSKIADVFFVTAVPPQCMSARAERLMMDFPEIPTENIILGTRKDIIQLDIVLDDASHNISSSRASYPVLFRKPWNTNLSGLLSVTSYGDFIHLVQIIRNSFVEKPIDLTKGGVICLVGPTGSLKTEIVSELCENPKFVQPQVSTTKPSKDNETINYRYISKEEFFSEKQAGRYIETSVYKSHNFGLSLDDINPIIQEKKYAVLTIDICGALTIKNIFNRKSMLIFINREKSACVADIVSRKSSVDDKVMSIMSLDYEYKNAVMCDKELSIENDYKKAAQDIIKIVKENKSSQYKKSYKHKKNK